MDTIFKFFKSKSIKNSLWIIGEQVFQMAVSFVVGILTARYLGPSNYGALNYTASFVAFALSFATLGMEGVVIKKMIENPEREGEYLGSCMAFRCVASILSIITVIIVVAVLNPNDNLKLLLVSLQSFQLLFRALQILDSWFQRHLKSRYVSIGKMVACVVVSAYKVFLLATAKSIQWFALSNSLTDFVVAVMLFFWYKREKGQRLFVKKETGIEVLIESYHFIISGVMTAIFTQMDRIMIGGMLSDIDVGFYTTAANICSMWIFVPTAVINSFRPKIMEIKQSGNEDLYLTRLKQLYASIIWMCVLVSVGIALLAQFIVTFLYGEAYLGAVDPLRILIWCETFSMIGSARGIWVLCENKNKYVKYYLGIGVVVNLILNYLLIPAIGINGAAIATLATQIVTSTIAPLLFKETRIHTKYVIESFFFIWHKNSK